MNIRVVCCSARLVRPNSSTSGGFNAMRMLEESKRHAAED